MSGGSHNYLYSTDVSEVFARLGDIDGMARRMDVLGYAGDAASETRELLRIAEQFQLRIHAYLSRLGPVWKAVEWWDSGDSSEEEVKDALADYRKEGADGSVILSPNVVNTLREVLRYNWEDESQDYRQQIRENSEGADTHIFHALVRLRDAIGSDEYLTDPE